MTDRLLTARDVADLLGLSPASVLRRWRCGELPGYRLGSNVLRFDPADVEAFLAARRCGIPSGIVPGMARSIDEQEGSGHGQR